MWFHCYQTCLNLSCLTGQTATIKCHLLLFWESTKEALPIQLINNLFFHVKIMVLVYLTNNQSPFLENSYENVFLPKQECYFLDNILHFLKNVFFFLSYPKTMPLLWQKWFCRWPPGCSFWMSVAWPVPSERLLGIPNGPSSLTLSLFLRETVKHT